jgi:hypothetical protein
MPPEIESAFRNLAPPVAYRNASEEIMPYMVRE